MLYLCTCTESSFTKRERDILNYKEWSFALKILCTTTSSMWIYTPKHQLVFANHIITAALQHDLYILVEELFMDGTVIAADNVYARKLCIYLLPWWTKITLTATFTTCILATVDWLSSDCQPFFKCFFVALRVSIHTGFGLREGKLLFFYFFVFFNEK